MAKDNTSFFERKQIWSIVKDELLGCYLKPYISKILATRRPLFYVDCFAGKGRFDDGSNGSPLIALEIIDSCLGSTHVGNPMIESCYIDLNYAEDLYKNLDGFKNINIVSGRYEETILGLLAGRQKENIFLYIDPYGIKALDCGLFDRFAESGFNSIELLINMNSFGFMREACRAMKATQKDIRVFDEIIGDELVEYDPSQMDSSEKSMQILTDIAGGDYWCPIVADFLSKKISGHEAEIQFSEQYCLRLKQSYNYVLNMPIRLKKGQQPKYRMIHLTNHADGCLLMYENICKRWEVLDEIQEGGQTCMFKSTIEGDHVDLEDIKAKVRQHLAQYETETSLNKVLADFCNVHGILCKKSHLIDMLQDMEVQQKILVRRDPAVTRSGKRASSFFTETAEQHVYLKRRI